MGDRWSPGIGVAVAELKDAAGELEDAYGLYAYADDEDADEAREDVGALAIGLLGDVLLLIVELRKQGVPIDDPLEMEPQALLDLVANMPGQAELVRRLSERTIAQAEQIVSVLRP